MAKFSLYLFTIAVFLGATSADITCLLKELMAVSPDHFISSPSRACRNIESKFSRTRQELEKCLDFEVDTTMMESLHNEFCTPNSDFRQKIDRQRDCLTANMQNGMRCVSGMEDSEHLKPENVKGKTVYDICHSVSKEMAKCMAEKIGRPCGEEGVEVYTRMVEVSQPFFTGSCYSVARLGIDESEFAGEVGEAEKKAVESSLDDSEREEYAATATANSALAWCMLLGLLLTTKWW